MAEGDTKIIYDAEEDILLLSKIRKVKASISIGDFIIDVDSRGFISGVEILNASENMKIPPKVLSELKKASMSVTYKQNYIYIFLVMKFERTEKEIAIPLTVDLGHKTVHSENTQFAVA
jgi:uncharacterized protein YuzE